MQSMFPPNTTAMIQDFKQYANAVHPKKSGKNLFVLATDASKEV